MVEFSSDFYPDTLDPGLTSIPLDANGSHFASREFLLGLRFCLSCHVPSSRSILTLSVTFHLCSAIPYRCHQENRKSFFFPWSPPNSPLESVRFSARKLFFFGAFASAAHCPLQDQRFFFSYRLFRMRTFAADLLPLFSSSFCMHGAFFTKH